MAAGRRVWRRPVAPGGGRSLATPGGSRRPRWSEGACARGAVLRDKPAVVALPSRGHAAPTPLPWCIAVSGEGGPRRQPGGLGVSSPSPGLSACRGLWCGVDGQTTHSCRCVVGQKPKEKLNALVRAGHQNPRKSPLCDHTSSHTQEAHSVMWSMLLHPLQLSNPAHPFQPSPHCFSPISPKASRQVVAGGTEEASLCPIMP